MTASVPGRHGPRGASRWRARTFRGLPLATLLLVAGTDVSAAPISPGPRDRSVMSWVAEASRLAGPPDRPLAGFAFDKVPLLLVDPGRMAMAFHVPVPLPGFRPLSAVGRAIQWRQGPTTDLDSGSLEVNLAGQRLVSAPYDLLPTFFPTGPSPSSLLVLGLNRHVLARAPWARELRGRSSASVPGGRGLARELDALGMALVTREPAAQKAALVGFLVARKARHAALPASEAQAEDHREALRALIRHWPMTRQAVAARGATRAGAGALPWRHASGAEYLAWLRSRCTRLAGSQEQEGDTLLVTALVQATMLDRLAGDQWPERVLRAGSVTAVLARTLGFDEGMESVPAESGRHVEEQVGQLGMDRAERLSAFDMQPGIAIALELPAPVGGQSRQGGLSWNPVQRPPLRVAPRTVLLEGLMSLAFEGRDRTLDVSRLPVLGVAGDRAWPFARLVFRADPRALQILVDGRRIPRTPGLWRFQRRLELLHPQFRYVAHHGRLRMDEEQIEVSDAP